MIFEAERHERQAISETTAFLMSSMLADVVDSGTAARARTLGFKLPAAGKTGTTNDFVDAWFVGFTPRLVAGVWVGYDESRPIMANGFAAGIAVPLWAEFMKAATRNDAKDWFDPPPESSPFRCAAISGMLPVTGCKSVQTVDANGNVSYKSAVYTEYFARGKEPVQTCDVHSKPHWRQPRSRRRQNPPRASHLGLPEAPPESPPPAENPPAVTSSVRGHACANYAWRADENGKTTDEDREPGGDVALMALCGQRKSADAAGTGARRRAAVSADDVDDEWVDGRRRHTREIYAGRRAGVSAAHVDQRTRQHPELCAC